MNPFPEPARENPKHLAWLRLRGCCVPGCARPGVDPHHVRLGTDCGMGLKPSDRFAVPLCHEHHDEAHRGQRSFDRKYGIELRAIADEMAALSPFCLPVAA